MLRHPIIENLLAQHAEKSVEDTINSWQQIASKVISIVGEDGFNSLYERTVFLAQQTFPGLADGALSQADNRFAGLKKCLQNLAPTQVTAVNKLLLVTFTDILISLIGEQLTTSILRSAFSKNASDRVGKEVQNEKNNKRE